MLFINDRNRNDCAGDEIIGGGGANCTAQDIVLIHGGKEEHKLNGCD